MAEAGAKRRIFVAEDNDDLALLLERRLAARAGWTVVRAATRDEAHRRLQGDRFDAVVLDYLLPDGTGLDLLPVVRAAAPETPVLFLTAHGSEDVALRALSLGATDYMQKDGRLLEDIPQRLDDLLAREGDVARAARVVPVRGAPRPEPAAHAPPAAAGVPDLDEAAQALQEAVKGDVLGAALFDGAGRPIAALLPATMEATRLGAAVFTLHAQVGALGRLAGLAPLGYAFVLHHEEGILATSALAGRCLAAVLVSPSAGEPRAREALKALEARLA